jgi:hypothetical protein
MNGSRIARQYKAKVKREKEKVSARSLERESIKIQSRSARVGYLPVCFKFDSGSIWN